MLAHTIAGSTTSTVVPQTLSMADTRIVYHIFYLPNVVVVDVIVMCRVSVAGSLLMLGRTL